MSSPAKEESRFECGFEFVSLLEDPFMLWTLDSPNAPQHTTPREKTILWINKRRPRVRKQ